MNTETTPGEENQICKFCKEKINPEASRCKNCGNPQKGWKSFGFWTNRLAFILSIIAIIGNVVIFFKYFQKIDRKVDFEYISFDDDLLQLTFLNNSEKNFYLTKKIAEFYINNITKSKKDTIHTELEFNNKDHELILKESDILKFEFRPKDSIPKFSIDTMDNYTIYCNLQFNLKVSSNKEIIEKVKFKVTKKDMFRIEELLRSDSGS